MFVWMAQFGWRRANAMAGPLAGLKIIEVAGIGPAPFACMMLADHGAEVVRVERPGAIQGGPGGDMAKDVLLRSRRTIAVDLKSAEGRSVVLSLTKSADGLVEGFRPGAMERLGLGPELLIANNPKLVYGRMTGWGQTGPFASMAGHDINYLALAGVLDALGRAGEKPTPPINLVGDFGGGGMMLAFGMVSALLAARETGCGQVVDCAMAEGAALLMSMIWSFRAQGIWSPQRGTNFLDTGAHFYDSYETADGRFVAIGSVEPQFYARLLKRLGLDTDPDFISQYDQALWPNQKEKLATLFRTKSREEWSALLEDNNSCFSPVLSMDEVSTHPHHVSRQNFSIIGDTLQPMPAPRYSITETAYPTMSRKFQTDEVLSEVGFTDVEICKLRSSGIIE